MSSDIKSLESEVYPVGDWQKLKILLWKNWILQRNQKIQIIVGLIFPLVFISLLVILRILVLPEKMPESRYKHVPIESLVLFLQWVKMGNRILHSNGTLNIPKAYLCYTPDTPTNAAIARSAAIFLFLNGTRPYESAEKMEHDMLEHNFLVGVEFGQNDGGAMNQRFPLNFTYSLRFPSELRTMPGPVIETWHTRELFVRYDLSGPRNPEHDDGGVPDGYIREGFLPVQHALTMSWLSQATRQSMFKFPRVRLQRFPFRAYTFDPLLLGLRQLLPFIVILSFMYPSSVVTKDVTSEKELQLKDMMKLIGVDNWLHWIAWFLKSYLMLMMVVLLILFLFKVNFYTSVSILTNSQWIVILVFLHTYVIASICFCFMLAVFFSKASTASAVTCILWFITYIPYTFAFYYYEHLSLFGKLMIALVFSNSALGIGFNIIMDFEGTGMGATWSSMFHTVSADDDITLFYIIMTLTMSALIYLGICMYVEQVFPGNYGIARRWNFFLQRQFWCGSKPTDSPKKKHRGGTRKRQVGIQLNNLQKTFGKFKAVKGLNLKMYRDEITVLLGHNGAGKTTTLHMLTGIIAPTAGTALINGYDIRTQLDMARQSLGICPQHNILFMKMSVRDHIVFFSKLKGVRGSEAVNREVKKYVEVLGLQAKSKVAAENLSGGMKRKLSLCCAMCGSARVVLCDEPSSGIDAAGRKSLWELLQSEKQGRTVLLTTHYMDEADVLGDRIAILSEGKLQCHGTSFYLKKRYGTGYQLVCIMQKDCNVDAVTELINRHLPYLKPEREMGTELTYRLPHTESKKFSALLADLDRNCAKLKLSGYGLSVATLEDVFMEVNKEKRYEGGEEKNATPDFQTLVFDNKTRENRFLIRCLMCFQALMLKKIKVTFRNYWLMLIQILLPVVILVLAILNSRGGRIYYELPAMEISPFQYKSSFMVLEDNSTNDQLSPLAMAYAKHTERYGKRCKLLKTGDLGVEDYILGLGKKWNHRLDYAFIAGATMHKTNTTVWLNNKPLHTAPLTLNIFHNAMARHYLGERAGTYVTNKPLPYSDDTRVLRLSKGQRLGAEIALNLTLCMCFVTAFFAIPIIKERETRAKLLQFLSGVDAFSYWATMFIWDFLIFAISSFMAVITICAFQEPGYSSVTDLSRYYVMLLIFGLGGLPISYVLADCFSDTANGFVRIGIFNLATGCATYMLYITLSFEAFKLQDVAKQMAWYFRIFPHYCLASATRHLHISHNIRSGCSVPALKRIPQEVKCKKLPMCCKIPGYFAWKHPGVLPEIMYIIIVAILLFLFLIITDSKLIHSIRQALRRLGKSSKKRKTGGSSENQDVVAERMLVRELLGSRRKEIPLLVDNVRKQYRKKLAVRGVSFHVGSAECFGLLGINGAGKTSVFKMLTGDHEITSGDAYIDGLSVSTQLRQARHKIGYCPQFDAIFEDLTGTQNLRIYCLLRGVQRRYVKDISWTLARAFGFENYMNKQSKHYSGGNKRKLSTAIAILGNPSVVFLDEPTSGMDPGARRNLWQIMDLIRTAGKSLVLTSHSMDECEALCTRLTIMVDGEFKCIGSTQSLKNQYAKGLILKVKVKFKKKNFQRIIQRSSSSCSETLELDRVLDENSARVVEEIKLKPDTGFSNRILIVNTFILKNIRDAELKDEYNGLLTYFMPQNESLAKVFQLIEENQKKLCIEDYLVTQTRLEEVFLDFALNCENRESDVIEKKKCCC
ncbi:ATP-binding cassette sub-family A member 3-like isoform X2 [Drosophila serrata]|uniref:ATP-binding cassette sub-family A member 3-like isoform X2 n=1 Tax=Drosophila serrata TaxID=7274 RepID=UPI000A1D02B7|nr:ATP-binding cassette sub-family A member 3-like isoform X2 [Drosophila serrata]